MSELERWAAVLVELDRGTLVDIALSADIRLTAAHEEIGWLRAELARAKGEKR